MIAPVMIAAGVAVFMFGLLIEAAWFRVVHDDPPALYRLYAVRDGLIRLVAEKKISPDDPSFKALYKNITILLRASRCLSGPDGWDLAEMQGKALARCEVKAARFFAFPPTGVPLVLQDVANELRSALGYLIQNHFGIFVQIDARRREVARIRKEQAKQLLQVMREDGPVGCPAH